MIVQKYNIKEITQADSQRFKCQYYFEMIMKAVYNKYSQVAYFPQKNGMIWNMVKITRIK